MDHDIEEPLLIGTNEVVQNVGAWEQLSDEFMIENKKTWLVAIPTILGRFSNVSINIISQTITRSFVGHIGSTELAAYTLVSSVLLKFSHGILLGMASGLETLCEQAYNARDYRTLSVYLQRSWLVLLITTVLFTPLFIFASPILQFLKQDEAIAEIARDVSYWFIPLIFSIIFFYTCQMFLKAKKRNRITLYLVPSMLPLHLVLSWILTMVPMILAYGQGRPRPKSGLGTPSSRAAPAYGVPTIGQLAFICFGGCRDTWKGFSVLAFEDLFPIVNHSLSSGVIMCLKEWYMTILMLITGNMEDAEVAIDAFSICLSFNGSWEMLISFGFLAAPSVRVSDELEKGSIKAAKFAIMNLMLISFGHELVLFIFLQERLAYVFTNSAEITVAVADLSPLLACSIFLNIIQSVLSGIHVGAILGRVTKLQVKGVWTGMLIVTLVEIIILAIITWKTDWDKQVTIAQRRVNERLVEQPNASHKAQDNE